MRDLKGRNAILTGASRGLGVNIAHALADEGVNITLAARSAEGLASVQTELGPKGVSTITVPTDVSDDAQLDILVTRAEAEIGPTDILVNNAGIEAMYRSHEYPPDEVRSLININLIAAMILSQKVLGGMLARRRGHIVQLASLAGKAGVPCQGPYAASKAGMVAYAWSLRAELIDEPVGSSAVCPGFVGEAGMYQDLVDETGQRASKLAGESSPDDVAAGVIKAIKRDLAQVIVNPSPIRPLVVAGEMFPNLTAPILKWMGVTKLTTRTADILAERRASS